jgi:hypothetical protein
MCNLKLSMCPHRQSSSAFVPRLLPAGISLLSLRVTYGAEQVFFITSLRSQHFMSDLFPMSGLRPLIPEEDMPSLGSTMSL